MKSVADGSGGHYFHLETHVVSKRSMNGVTQAAIEVPLATWARHVLFGLFAAAWVVVLARAWWPGIGPHYWHWPEALLLLLGTSFTLAALGGELPWQNVLTVSVIVGLTCLAVEALFEKLGLGFRLLPYGVKWSSPLIGLVLILNARATAQFLLQRWQKTANYGFLLVGLSALITAQLGLGLGRFEQVRGTGWLGNPWFTWLSWLAVAGVGLVLAMPWLINKKRANTDPSWQPVIVWLMLNLLFASAQIAPGKLV